MKVRELLDELPNPETEGRVSPESARMKYELTARNRNTGSEYDVEDVEWDSENETFIFHIKRR